MSQKGVTIIIVDKGASLKTLTVKVYNVEELYKKCGFKKSEDFNLQVEWPVKLDGQRYLIQMYGKLDGKANMENKYDFPPPVDKNLYFGSCALVGMIRDDTNNRSHINLTIELWNKIYEKLFGGFDDIDEDEEPSEDELEKVPKSMKTKHGYLKDGFVVDNAIEGGDEDDDDDEDYDEGNDVDDDTDNEYEEENIVERVRKNHKHDDNDEEDKDELEGSELEEEPYEYSDEE